MTGLDKIIAEIKSDSESLCSSINNTAQLRCEDILKEAQSQALRIKSDGEIKAKKIYDDIICRAKSSAELEHRSIMLQAKQDIIAQSLENARHYFCNLPAHEYFELILKMIAKHSENSDGVIRFCKSDLERLPSDFEKNLKDYAKGNLLISKEPAPIDGGFILVYDMLEVNCSFASVFMAESELFSDEISRALFS